MNWKSDSRLREGHISPGSQKTMPSWIWFPAMPIPSSRLISHMNFIGEVRHVTVLHVVPNPGTFWADRGGPDWDGLKDGDLVFFLTDEGQFAVTVEIFIGYDITGMNPKVFQL